MRLPKLKWWQWGLAGLLAVGVVGAIVNPPEPTPEPTGRIVSVSILRTDLPVYAAVAEPGTPAQDAEAKARELCGPASHCDVMAWADPSLKAKGFPMTAREADGVVYSYRVNRATGYEGSAWDCARFPDAPPDGCISN